MDGDGGHSAAAVAAPPRGAAGAADGANGPSSGGDDGQDVLQAHLASDPVTSARDPTAGDGLTVTAVRIHAPAVASALLVYSSHLPLPHGAVLPSGATRADA